MTVICLPEIETLPTETFPERCAGGWSLRPQPRVGLNLGSDDELLLLENRTTVPWVIHHNFHQLGIIDPYELLLFHLCKHGSLSVRPYGKGDAVDYLVLSLNYYVNQVHIYIRSMGRGIEVYDMRMV